MINIVMKNIKERGITVGDLVILLIIIISTFFIVKQANKENKSSFNYNQTKLLLIEYKNIL